MSNTESPLLALRELGQAVWLDVLDRQTLTDGTLQRLIATDGLAGLITSPTTFKESIEQDPCYQAAIEQEARQGSSAADIYHCLIVKDARAVADEFRPLYDQTDGHNGFVSFEISPLLAHDTEATINEARHLWQQIGKPNAMIAVPATKAGLPAIKQLVSEGININGTLLFSVGRYLEMAYAYLAGLEERLAANKPIASVTSVASFFLNRIDLKVDHYLEQIAQDNVALATKAHSVRGKAALASAGFAYERFAELYAQPRWQQLAKHGARKQRLLWTSTSTEDSFYSDIKYVESLIGPETVNAMPLATLQAYRQHGQPENRIAIATREASEIMHQLAELKIDLRIVDEDLEVEGIQQFIEPYIQLLTTLERRRAEAEGIIFP